jgi:pimeloyl-ACP methyl ester carboxylesterase
MNPPEPHQATVTVHGHPLAYADWPGERGPLICVPHLTGHKGSFAPLARHLAPEYRVIAVDLRGRGDSAQPPHDYGFAHHARDLLGLADALGIARFALVGHSFGATTSVYLASIQPSRIQALVMLDGGADPKENTLKAMYPAIRRLGRPYASMDAYLSAMQAIPFFQPWSAALDAYFREDVVTRPDGSVIAKSSAEAIERDLDIHFYYCMCLHFPNMHCPTLFVRPMRGLLGDKGHVFTETEAAAVVRHIPGCQRVDVPEVNHYTLLIHDQPPIVAPIRAFLAEKLR